MNELRFDHLPWTHERSAPLSLVVLHWTGGRSNAAKVYDALKKRRLSIHYVVNTDGSVVQMCSESLVCQHVKTWQGVSVNERSVGIEVVGPGFPTVLQKGTLERIPNQVWEAEKKAGVKRLVYRDKIKGATASHLDYTEAQHEAVRLLVGEICERQRIPYDVPRDAHGNLRTDALSKAELLAYRGVLGHYHVSTSKRDPGTEPLRRLMMPRAA